MAEYTCRNCVYAVCDPRRWLRLMSMGEPILPRCASHPWYPGRLHDVPGVPCRNYRPRPATPEGDQVRMIPRGDGYYAYVDARGLRMAQPVEMALLRPRPDANGNSASSIFAE